MYPTQPHTCNFLPFSLCSCRKQISDAVSGALASEAALHTDAAADALAAACALDALDSQSALALLLSSRRTWIQAQLAAHHETGGSVGSVAEVGQTLARLANAVQATVQQVRLRVAGEKHGEKLWTSSFNQPCLVMLLPAAAVTAAAGHIFRCQRRPA